MFTKLLLPLDRSALAEQAVGRVGALARACGAEVDVVLVHETDQFAAFGEEHQLESVQIKAEEQYVQDFAREIASSVGVSTSHAVLRGEAVSGIIARARQIGADLIVMTSHGRTGFSRAWLGSVADGVIRNSCIPVLMQRPVEGVALDHASTEFRTILIPVDGSPEALGIIDAAATLARSSGARIVLLQVVPPVPLVTADAAIGYVYPTPIPDEVATAGLVTDVNHHLAGVARMLAERGCANVTQKAVVSSGVARAVLDVAHSIGADLIAMSTHGRGASRLLIGSMADKIVRGSGLPVLLRRQSAASAVAVPSEAKAGEQRPLLSIA
ncbi:MAG: universal stress protein [bacterium]